MEILPVTIDAEVKKEFEGIDRRLNNGKDRMDKLEAAIAENTKITREIKDIVDLGRSFFIILGHIGTVAKWIGAIGTAIAAIYALFHLNQPPGK